jgi:sugar phosphate isomerase/epimerase
MRLGFTPLNAQIIDLEAAFRLAVELELQFVELAFDMQELLPMSQPVAQVNALQRNTGVGVTVHLSYVDLNLASLMPGVARNSVERTQRGLEYAISVNAHCGVLHTGLVPLRHPMALEAARGTLEESLKALEPLVPIALENLALTEYDLLRGAGELEAVTKAVGFGNCIDVGHALVEGCTTAVSDSTGSGGVAAGHAQLEGYIHGLSNVIHLHLQDNEGSSDAHRALGLGGLEWTRVRAYLKRFHGTVNLEVGPDAEAVRQSVRFLKQLLQE